MAFLDETGLAELWSLIRAEDDTKAQIAIGSYTGANTSGSSGKNTLTFDFVPKMVAIVADGVNDAYAGTLFVQGQTVSNYFGFVNDTSKKITVSWSGNSVSWYASYANSQFNASGKTFLYVAIG